VSAPARVIVRAAGDDAVAVFAADVRDDALEDPGEAF
jgi:hypothetical protein